MSSFHGFVNSVRLTFLRIFILNVAVVVEVEVDWVDEVLFKKFSNEKKIDMKNA